MTKVSAELVRRQAAELQDLALSVERAGELANEVDGLNRSVRASARELDFDDEPAGFQRVLRARAMRR